MKSTRTPHTHIGVTTEEITSIVGPGRYSVTVPAGTRVHKLDGGSDPWVVDDLGFIADKRGIVYSDADIYGIRIPEAKITNIVTKEAFAAKHNQQRAEAERTLAAVNSILAKDEASTYEELVEHFVNSFGLTIEEATAHVARRDEELHRPLPGY